MDLANAIFTCMRISQKKIKKIYKKKLPIINIGTGENIKIKDLAEMISKLANFKGKINFDHSSPDGTYKKNLNSKNIKKLGWRPKIKLKEGLKEVISIKLN